MTVTLEDLGADTILIPLARENFPLPIMGTIIGAATMASSLGMAVGPLAGGLIFDAYGSYGWLYLGSFGTGLGAAAIMLVFRPDGSEQTKRAAAMPFALGDDSA